MSSYQLDPAGVPAAEARPAPARLGRYELFGHLATGGMAEIHLARLAGEAGFEKVVVVKRLLPELVASQAFVEMFLDEGKLVARLDHPNVCEVHELGRDGSEYFLAMPYLDGVSVHDLISRPREPDRLAELRVSAGIVVQACAGLHHAHELRDADGSAAGLVHRDVSPSNLFVTSAGIVKVLDFGIAKVRGATETEVGTIKGKTQYMAPEQLLGEPLDRRCDVFALGITLFELATHQRLFKRASDYLAARAILEEPIERADDVDPAIPEAVADVIAKALARDKRDRYADAAELAQALETTLAAHGGIAGPSAIAAVVTATDELTAQRTRQQKVIGEAALASGTAVETRRLRAPPGDPTLVAPRDVPRRRWLAPLLVGVVLVGAVAIGRRVTSTPSPPPMTPMARVVVPDAAPLIVAPVLVDAAIAPDAAESIEMPPDPARAKKKGTLNIDSSPFATIYVDGKRVDVTPLLNYAIAPGRHRIRAVLADKREKQITVDVPEGRAAKPISLTW